MAHAGGQCALLSMVIIVRTGILIWKILLTLSIKVQYGPHVMHAHMMQPHLNLILYQSSLITFNYIFASVEYPDWVCGQYSDVLGFFVTSLDNDGLNYNNTNVALIPGTKLPVAISTINSGSPGADSTIHPPIPYAQDGCKSLSYSKYYRNNSGNQYIVYNGLRVLPVQFKGHL